MPCLALELAHNRSVVDESGELTLHLEKNLPARVERVFAACVEPGKFVQWWGPVGFTTPSLDLDVQKGGRYRIRMQPPDGDAFHLRGEFSEVDPPRRLVFTFEWEEPDPDDQETAVTLSFLDDGEEMTLVLDQGPFATEARRALHEAGWTESFRRLEETLT
jgi:uncharacterized protein YndB with AHSA1/START domain